MVTSRREGIPAALAMKHTGHEDVKVFHGYQRNAVGDDMHAVAARVHEARKRAAGRNGAPANGAQAADAGEDGVQASTVPGNGTQANTAPVNGRVRARRALTRRATWSTNEAGGSHRLGVSRLSPAIPPQVATASPSYDFTS